MNVYILFALDEEPETRVGEFGHEIIGVYATQGEALEVADQYTCKHNSLLIKKSVLGDASCTDMKLELNKEEAALVEQLVEMHIDMLEDDSHSDEDTLADLKEARALHYKLLKFFRS